MGVESREKVMETMRAISRCIQYVWYHEK